MTRHAARILAAALALALAGCGSHNDKAPSDAAGGEVLKGTINDDMLPYDTVRSQPPLAAPSGTASPSDAKSAAPASQASDEAAELGPTGEPEQGRTASPGA